MKDLRLPYFLDESLPKAVREYLDLHISADIDLMTEYIIESYSQFSNKNPRLFRSSVKKAYEYIMETELKCNKGNNKKSTPKSLIVPVNSNSKQKKAMPLKGTKPVKNNSSGFKPEIMSLSPNRRKPSKKEQVNNSLFVIDVEGDDDVMQCDADVTILQPSEEINDKETPAKKIELVEENLSTPTTSIKKRDLEGKNIENSILEKLKKKARLNFDKKNEKVTFAELGGLEPVTESVYDALWSLRVPSLRPVTVLLSGPPASGKTVLVSAMAQSIGLPVVPVCLGELVNGTTLNPERKVLDSVMTAFSSAPAIVLLSQLDRVCRDGGSGTALSARQAQSVEQALVKALNYLRSSLQGTPLLVVAETNAVEVVEAQLIKCFKSHIAIKPPTAPQRSHILQRVCSKLHMSECVDFHHLGLKCSGYVAGDIVELVEEASIMATKRCGGKEAPASLDDLQLQLTNIELPTVTITQQDFLAATKKIIPVLKKEGFPAIPDTTWEDVGGLHSIREELRVKMIDPIKEPDLMSRYSNDTSGILLWGPPGCGKTLLAKAVANEAGINLLIVNGPDLLSMYQGESERAVRMVFGRAASVAPCVIFFDEFDSLCPRRSKTGTESGSKSTIVNTLLTEMNGFMDRAGVYVMAATNLPAVLDPAVLRPGRFDTLLYVGLPDLEGRVSVFKAATKNGTLPRLASDVDLQSIAARCSHFSGADCRHLVKTAETEAREELKRWRTTGDVIMEHSEHHEEQFHYQRSNVDTNVCDGSQNRKAQNSVEMEETGKENRDCSDQDWEDISEHDDSEHNEEDAQLPGTNKESAELNKDANTIILNSNACVLKNSCDNSNLCSTASSLDASRMQINGKIDHQRDNPFYEGDYLVYSRHFEAALNKVKPSVSKKERLNYEQQEKKKKFS